MENNQHLSLSQLFNDNARIVYEYLMESDIDYHHQVRQIITDGFANEVEQAENHIGSYNYCRDIITRAIEWDQERTEAFQNKDQKIADLKEQVRLLEKENEILRNQKLELELSPNPGPQFIKAQEEFQILQSN